MAYIYCADIYCDDCGKAIMKELKKQGLVPEHPEDRSTYDSDERKPTRLSIVETMQIV